MAKLKTINEWKFGQTNLLPIVGEVTFSKEGIIEVDDSIINQLIKLDIGLTIVEDSITTTTTSNEKEEVHETLPIVLKEEELVELQTMTVVELQKQASVFPKPEWKDLKKEELINYLRDKLKS